MKFRMKEGIGYLPNPAWSPKEGDAYPHRDPERMKLYKKGDVVEVEVNKPEDDLTINFPEKFERLREAETQVSDPAARKAAVAELLDTGVWGPDDREFLLTVSDDGFERIRRQAVTRKSENLFPSSSLGEDVTNQFVRAYDEGMKVYKNPAGKHQVVRPPEMTRPINPEPLPANKVDAFIDRWLKEQK
jgi:hypothetical protein